MTPSCCKSDDDCTSDKICQNRACIALASGLRCRNGQECSFWQYCNRQKLCVFWSPYDSYEIPSQCNNSKECPTDQYCSNRRCVQRLKVGQACNESHQVWQNHYCHQGLVASPCVVLSDCATSDQTCDFDVGDKFGYCISKYATENPTQFANSATAASNTAATAGTDPRPSSNDQATKGKGQSSNQAAINHQQSHHSQTHAARIIADGSGSQMAYENKSSHFVSRDASNPTNRLQWVVPSAIIGSAILIILAIVVIRRRKRARSADQRGKNLQPPSTLPPSSSAAMTQEHTTSASRQPFAPVPHHQAAHYAAPHTAPSAPLLPLRDQEDDGPPPYEPQKCK